MAKIIEKFNKSKYTYSEGFDVEQDLYNYILNSKSNDYNKVFKKDKRWTVFYHLTDIRKGILAWYPFDKNKTCLEIGAGLGSMTDLLCQKCKSVTSIEMSKVRAQTLYERHKKNDNLTIFVGDLKDIEINDKFDYITLIGVLEYQGRYYEKSNNFNPYVKFIEHLKQYLKPDGKILIAIENRFGLKYWCGIPEDHTGLAFDGINGYNRSKSAKTFSKNELHSIIKNAGLNNIKFYYPLPDYKLPNMIFSDEYLPKEDINNRFREYYLDYRGLLLNEERIIKDIIQNNVFPFFANSFFVECTNGINSDIKYATLTYDRKKTLQLATIMDKNNVKKIPLSDKSISDIKIVDENLKELSSRGIKVVDYKYSNNEIVMPIITDMSFDNYLIKLAKKRKLSEFKKEIKRFYEYILKSSPISEKNSLIDDKICTDTNIDFGPIMKDGFIDFLFHNSFIIKGEIVMFDQEFKEPNIPANFMIYRSLKNLYYENEWLEEIIPINDIEKMFGITKVIRYYDILDLKLLSKLRDNNVTEMLKKYSYYDKNIITENQVKLLNLDGTFLKQNNVLKNDNDNLISSNNELNKINITLTKSNDKLNKINIKLSKSNDELNKINIKLSKSNDELNKINKNLSEAYEKLKQEYNDINELNNKLICENNLLKEKKDQNIGD